MVTDPYKDSAERFARDAADHEMTVLHDDGLYRHLRFRQPDRGAYWFDLVTWPGALSITGDVDGYVFRRLHDMFEFFRSPGCYCINPSYWSEKVVTGKDQLKRYSDERFRQYVNENVADAEHQWPGLTAAVELALRDDYDAEYEDGARRFLRDFSYATNEGQARIAEAEKAWRDAPESARYAQWKAFQEIKNRETFEFADAHEWDLGDWDWQFLWACHAIRWGIGQYDASRKPATATVGGAS